MAREGGGPAFPVVPPPLPDRLRALADEIEDRRLSPFGPRRPFWDELRSLAEAVEELDAEDQPDPLPERQDVIDHA